VTKTITLPVFLNRMKKRLQAKGKRDAYPQKKILLRQRADQDDSRVIKKTCHSGAIAKNLLRYRSRMTKEAIGQDDKNNYTACHPETE
jgi:hypothetical protein